MDIGKYSLMIYKRAWQAHKQSGVPYEDCFQESTKIALEAIRKYDPSKDKTLASWIWDNMNGYMWHYSLVQKREGAEDFNKQEFVENLSREDRQFKSIDFKDFMKSKLSKNSMTIIEKIFDKNITMHSKCKKYSGCKQKITKDSILKYFVGLGWKRCDIVKSFKEIGCALREWKMVDSL